ncbi:S-adenosyl-L-methionine-dependent methyltransferase [Coprinopsis sp. MPI-PUGE-AT-0042]|nr:S-adenosyl-L-methionine-dependent methyltransferase [Coprinopsis sp. MPI-PUGE-AT-0042]
MRALEFYSGIGGLHLALSRVDREHKVVRAFDWDQTACRVYEANHGKDIVEKVGTYSSIIWLLSPACQPYTVLNPNARGALDPRAHSYLHLLQDVIPGLVGMWTCTKVHSSGERRGYESSTTRRVQTRGLKMKEGDEEEERKWRYIPDELNSGGLNEEENQEIRPREEEEYSVPDKIWGSGEGCLISSLPLQQTDVCFTRGYTHLVERSGSILQVDEDLDVRPTSTFDEFARVQKAQSQASHGSSPDFISSLDDPLQILHPLRLRYFTPSELLRIFGFDRIEGEQGDNTSRKFKSKYKLIGTALVSEW